MILIYITNKNLKQAKLIAKHLLKNKLIACANLFPIKSMYLWQKKIEDDNEIVLLAKTKNSNYKKIEKVINELLAET